MIPVRLEVKNFLPYRSPDPLYFEGIHLACLTGHNGAGKSSLLDAITWALWGKARAKRDDDLVHMGQTDMHVQLDFEQEGSIYRVLRRRGKGKRGVSSLEFFAVQEDNSIRTFNEPSMRETQGKINAILRMDYETFINSAFLQQGKADAFTTKTAAERKRILSDILGLDQWTTYEDRVKAHLKELDRIVASINGVLESIEQDLKKEPQYQQERESAQRLYEIADQARLDAEKSLAEIADAPANLQNARENMNRLQIRLGDLKQDLNHAAEEINTRQEAIDEYSAIIVLGEDIEGGYRSLQEARNADSTLGARLREISDVSDRINILQSQIERARAEVEREISASQASIREIESRINHESASDYEALSLRIAEMSQKETRREELNQTSSVLREDLSGLNAQLSSLKDEGTRINSRIDQLEKTADAHCPLCGQPLDEAHRRQTIAEITSERDQKRALWTQTTARIAEVTTEIKLLKEQTDALGDEIAPLPALRGQLGALAREMEESQAAQQRLEESYSLLQQLQQRLDQEDYAHELRTQLQEIQDQRAAIQYDRGEHENIQSQLTELREYETQYSRLQLAREALPREERALQNVVTRHTRLETALADESKQHEKLKAEIEELGLKVQEYQRREAEARTQRTAATQARERVIVAEQQLAALAEQRKRKDQQIQRRAQALEERGVFEELQLAFGKNGIPAMIIESVIPELEAAANELLARMTDGKMHMRLTTQREKVSGGLMETLDIEIADELGTRTYEMYSGGEAFRIDFAIRIALSRMLARRAGAHLRTLFIDEGFGTQDDDGRNKLVEAINAIQNDFDLILVITHIDELRDAFPVHVIVEKTASGSMINIR